tara:strand:- start:426 stop:1280 length:855 start_codon:yes stop_codon:yes gene_type:complete
VSKLPGGEIKSNLGDLLRCMVLLGNIGNNFLWLTDSKGQRLLQRFIDPARIALIDNSLKSYQFSSHLKIFYLDNYIHNSYLGRFLKGEWNGYIVGSNGTVVPANKKINLIEPYVKCENDGSWQQSLIEGVGFRWEKQDYPLQLKQCAEVFDVGLNWNVHPQWTSKQWSKLSWIALHDKLKTCVSVSWQDGLNNIEKYMDWMSSCKIIVTCDTLGLHLASALRKKVVAIIGSTENREFSYGRIKFIRPPDRECIPCNKPVCTDFTKCLDSISVEKVLESINKIIM